VQNTIKC